MTQPWHPLHDTIIIAERWCRCDAHSWLSASALNLTVTLCNTIAWLQYSVPSRCTCTDRESRSSSPQKARPEQLLSCGSLPNQAVTKLTLIAKNHLPCLRNRDSEWLSGSGKHEELMRCLRPIPTGWGKGMRKRKDPLMMIYMMIWHIADHYLAPALLLQPRSSTLAPPPSPTNRWSMPPVRMSLALSCSVKLQIRGNGINIRVMLGCVPLPGGLLKGWITAPPSQPPPRPAGTKIAWLYTRGMYFTEYPVPRNLARPEPVGLWLEIISACWPSLLTQLAGSELIGGMTVAYLMNENTYPIPQYQ